MFNEVAITKYLIGLSQKLITAAIKQWKQQSDATNAQELELALKALESSKSLQTKLEQRLLVSLQSLRASKKLLEGLRQLVSDEILCSEIGVALADGKLTPDSLAEKLSVRGGLGDVDAAELKAMCIFWLEAIYLSIGEVSELSRALLLRGQHRIESKVDTVDLNIQNLTTEIVEPGLARIENKLQKVDSKISLFALNVEASGGTPQALQSRFEKRFISCRERLIRGSVRQAEEEFAELIADLQALGKGVDRDLLFRSFLNHSSAMSELNRFDDAEKALEEAKKLGPDDVRLKRHEAVLLSLRGDFEGALKLVRALRVLEPLEDKHLINEANLLLSLNNIPELMEFLNNNPRESVDYYCCLAHASLRAGERDKAEASARKACELEPSIEYPWMALAYTLGFPVIEDRQSDDAKSLSPQQSDIEKLGEAVRAANRAAEILRKREREDVLSEVLANALAFHAALNDDERALEIGRELWARGVRSEVVLQNLFFLNLRNQLPDKALEIANAMVLIGHSDDAELRRLQALVRLGESEPALREWGRRWEKQNGEFPGIEWVELATRAYGVAHQAEQALTLLENFLRDQPRNAALRLLRADVLRQLGRIQEAEDEYKIAEQIAPQSVQVSINYGQFLYSKNRWAEASQRFEKIGAASFASPLHKEFMICLFNSKNYVLCQQLVSTWLKSETGFDGIIYGLGARLAFLSEDFVLARELLEVLGLRGSDHDLMHRKMLGQAFMMLDEVEQAFTLLSSVVVEQPQDSEASLLLGQVCSLRGRHIDAVEHVRRAVKLAPENAQVRAAFFGTMLALPANETPSQECLNDHYENIAILANHPSGMLKAIEVEREGKFDPSELHKALEEKETSDREILKITSERPLPLGFLAKQIGSPLHEIWAACTEDKNRGIRMSVGTSQEQKEELALAQEVQAISIDYIALITIQALGLLEVLLLKYSTIYVHISVLHVVVEQLRLLRDLPNRGRIGALEGKLLLTEANPQEESRKLIVLEEIRAFLKKTTVKLTGLQLDFPIDSNLRGFANSCGKESIFPIFVAQERKTALLSDDLVVKGCANSIAGVRTFCTQSFLRAVNNNGLINENQYQDALLKLLDWNYHFVSHDNKTMIRMFECTIGPPTELALSLIENLNCDEQEQTSRLKMLATFTAYLWTLPTAELKTHQESWATCVWRTIIHKDSGGVLVGKFVAFLMYELRTLPAIFFAAIDWAQLNVSEVTTRRAQLNGYAIAFAEELARNPSNKLGLWPAMIRQWVTQAGETRRLLLWRVIAKRSALVGTIGKGNASPKKPT